MLPTKRGRRIRSSAKVPAFRKPTTSMNFNSHRVPRPSIPRTVLRWSSATMTTTTATTSTTKTTGSHRTPGRRGAARSAEVRSTTVDWRVAKDWGSTSVVSCSKPGERCWRDTLKLCSEIAARDSPSSIPSAANCSSIATDPVLRPSSRIINTEAGLGDHTTFPATCFWKNWLSSNLRKTPSKSTRDQRATSSKRIPCLK